MDIRIRMIQGLMEGAIPVVTVVEVVEVVEVVVMPPEEIRMARVEVDIRKIKLEHKLHRKLMP